MEKSRNELVFNTSIEDIELLEKIGIKYPRDCLGHRLFTKSIESVGDHAVSIARSPENEFREQS